MLRYNLRTLLILLAVGPPMLAGSWLAWEKYRTTEKPPVVEHFVVGYTPLTPTECWPSETTGASDSEVP